MTGCGEVLREVWRSREVCWDVGRGVGCGGDVKEVLGEVWNVWGSVLGCGGRSGKVCWKVGKCSGRCGKVCWSVGEVKKDVGKYRGRHGKTQHTSHNTSP